MPTRGGCGAEADPLKAGPHPGWWAARRSGLGSCAARRGGRGALGARALGAGGAGIARSRGPFQGSHAGAAMSASAAQNRAGLLGGCPRAVLSPLLPRPASRPHAPSPSQHALQPNSSPSPPPNLLQDAEAEVPKLAGLVAHDAPILAHLWGGGFSMTGLEGGLGPDFGRGLRMGWKGLQRSLSGVWKSRGGGVGGGRGLGGVGRWFPSLVCVCVWVPRLVVEGAGLEAVQPRLAGGVGDARPDLCAFGRRGGGGGGGLASRRFTGRGLGPR
jgi:hypothetical protein